MSLVSFTIAAIDKTRAAFASINQGLRKLTTGGDAATKKFTTLGLQAVGLGSVFALLGSQVRKAAQDIESIPGVDKDTIDSWEQLKGAAKAANDVLGSIVATSGHAVASLGRLTEFAWNVLVDGLDEAQKKLVEGERAMGILKDQGDIEARIAAIQKLGKAKRDLANVDETEGASVTRRRREADVLDQQALKIEDGTKQMLKQAEAIELRSEAERDYHKILEEHRKAATDASVAELKLGAAQLPLGENIRALENALSRVNAQYERYKNATDPEQIQRGTELLKRRTAITNELADAQKEQRKIAADAANVVTSSFEDAIFAGENLRGVLKGIGQDLMRYIFQQTITKSLGNLLTSGIGSMLGFRAEGGAVSASSPYIVGEKGPELFVPSQAGRIVPNHEMGGGSGGGGNTYIIDARGVDESVVSRLQNALIRLAGPGVVERRALNATRNYRQRSATASA